MSEEAEAPPPKPRRRRKTAAAPATPEAPTPQNKPPQSKPPRRRKSATAEAQAAPSEAPPPKPRRRKAAPVTAPTAPEESAPEESAPSEAKSKRPPQAALTADAAKQAPSAQDGAAAQPAAAQPAKRAAKRSSPGPKAPAPSPPDEEAAKPTSPPRKPRRAAPPPPEVEPEPPPPALRRYALGGAIDGFIHETLQLLTPKPTRGWRRKLEARWRRERAMFRNKTPATQKLYGSRFRAPLRQALEAAGVSPRVLKGVFEVVRVERELVSAVNEDYRRAVDSANRNLAPIAGWREILAQLTFMLDSADPRFLALGLMGVTGRRFVEILKFGDFAPLLEQRGAVMARQKWLLLFSGQAKTRGADNSMFGREYPIPVVAPAAKVLGAFRALRASREGVRWAEMTPAQLNAAVNPGFNKLLREYEPIARLWPATPALTLKALRAFYAEAAMEGFAPPMAKAPYFARILGHSEEQYDTALSYMTLSLNERGAQAGRAEVHRLLLERAEDRQKRLAEREAAEAKAALKAAARAARKAVKSKA